MSCGSGGRGSWQPANGSTVAANKQRRALEARDGRSIGSVKEIWETGAHDVLVIEVPDGRRVLLPAAGAFLHEIDVAGRRLVVEEIPGLLDPA